MQTTITIRHNGFHGITTKTIRVWGKPGDTAILSPAQIKKLDRAACGMSDCRCGETMLKALSDWGFAQEPCKIEIPKGGEIKIRGNYPQQY